MSENENDYSDYIQHQSNLSNVLSLLSGFSFTALTILLTQLPDPSTLMSQFTLFFLGALFYQFIFLLGWHNAVVIRRCKNIPPITKEITTLNSLVSLSYIWLSLIVVLMFLIWNLVYLALAIGVVYVIFIILGSTYVTKPFMEYRKTISQREG